MKIVPVVVWVDANERTGKAEITVVTRDGKSRIYDDWSLPKSVWDAMRDNKCIIYHGKEPERLIMVKEKEK